MEQDQVIQVCVDGKEPCVFHKKSKRWGKNEHMYLGKPCRAFFAICPYGRPSWIEVVFENENGRYHVEVCRKNYRKLEPFIRLSVTENFALEAQLGLYDEVEFIIVPIK